MSYIYLVLLVLSVLSRLLLVCEVTTRSLSALLRQHVAVVTAKPGPFVVAVNHILLYQSAAVNIPLPL